MFGESEQLAKSMKCKEEVGTPEWIRTTDLLLRRQDEFPKTPMFMGVKADCVSELLIIVPGLERFLP